MGKYLQSPVQVVYYTRETGLKLFMPRNLELLPAKQVESLKGHDGCIRIIGKSLRIRHSLRLTSAMNFERGTFHGYSANQATPLAAASVRFSRGTAIQVPQEGHPRDRDSILYLCILYWFAEHDEALGSLDTYSWTL